jgi:outer membrane protein OmpA-like peptidoglycan-associated protein
MNKRALIVLLASGTVAVPAFADDDKDMPKEGAIGFGTGIAIGAAAGGPVGAAIGAAMGAWFGERLHEEKSGRRESEAKVAALTEHSGSLESRLAGNERELNRIRADLGTERRAHRRQLEQALAIDVFFRTEESALDGATEERLADVAEIVTPVDGAMIRVEAYADARGTEKYNETLSLARAAAVREALVRGGLPAERILVEATGETHATAADNDVEGMARERRVTMTIVERGADNRVAREVQR